MKALVMPILSRKDKMTTTLTQMQVVNEMLSLHSLSNALEGQLTVQL